MTCVWSAGCVQGLVLWTHQRLARASHDFWLVCEKLSVGKDSRYNQSRKRLVGKLSSSCQTLCPAAHPGNFIQVLLPACHGHWSSWPMQAPGPGLRGWKNRPDSFATVINSSLVVDPQSNFLDPGFIFTDVSDHCWIVFGQARATVVRATRSGVSPTTNYVTVEKFRCHTLSTLVHWPNLTAVYCAYMKQMRLPSTGW